MNIGRSGYVGNTARVLAERSVRRRSREPSPL